MKGGGTVQNKLTARAGFWNGIGEQNAPRRLWRMRKPNYFLRLGGIITVIMVTMILVGMVWLPYSPTAMDAALKFDAPSLAHIFGTDDKGRDIFSRVMVGAGSTFQIALGVVLLGCIAGTMIGCLCGYFGGLADLILMRICDALTAFPSILLALVMVMLLGQGRYQVMLILGLLFIPSFARVVRSEVARQRGRNYTDSARLMGASHFRIIFRHILPNIFPVLLPTLSIGFNNAVLAEASMSYLGVGVQPPDASLGRMLSESQTFLAIAPWYALFTGLAIVLLILGFSMLGEGLQRSRR